MKKSILSVLIFTCSVVAALAQMQSAPKFASKAQKAILSLNTYDKNGDLMKSGTAFYVGPNGEAIADYQLFKGASKAMVVDASGKQYDVECILGADDTYSVVRFHVETKGNAVLKVAEYIQPVGAAVYALNYSKEKISTCPQATIEGVDSIDAKYGYYKMSNNMGDEYVGAPLLNQSGELVGILHSALGQGSDLRSYALDMRYREVLKIEAIQSRSASLALQNISIAKGIPDSQEECLVYSFFKSRSAGNDEYMDILNRFVAAYPQCAEAYYRRCTPLTDLQRFDEANADLEKYLSLSADKAVANMNIAQAIYNKLQFMPEPPYEKWTADVALNYVDKAIELENAANRDETPANLVKCKELKAQILSNKKDYDSVIALYEELNTGERKSPVYFYAMSLAKEARGDSASAVVADLDSAIAMFPEPMPADAAQFVLRRGQILARSGNYRHAVLDYNQYAYLLNSQVSDVFHYDRCQIEMEAHMFQQAFDDINSAITKAPNKVLYHIEKAGMCLKFNMIDDCITSCNDAISLNPNVPDSYRIRGYAQVQKNDMKSARASLEKAIELGDETSKEILKTYVK